MILLEHYVYSFFYNNGNKNFILKFKKLYFDTEYLVVVYFEHNMPLYRKTFSYVISSYDILRIYGF